ncbi:MAG: NAD(P)H-dependent oxidoreductase [Sphingomonas sp.]
MSDPLHILVILGSVREGRMAEPVGRWVLEQAAARPELACELVDLKDMGPALLCLRQGARGGVGTPIRSSSAGRRKIASADGYILITPEYNHGPPAVLKNRARLCLCRMAPQAPSLSSAMAATAERGRSKG